jgi:hypothetical protein
MNGAGCRATARIMGVGLNTIFRHLKTQAAVTRSYSRAVTSSSGAEMDEQWGYVGAKSRQRWLFTRMTGPEDAPAWPTRYLTINLFKYQIKTFNLGQMVIQFHP